MAQGRLEVSGTIDLSQFWPKGASDADTSKIHVRVGPGAFQFRPSPTAALKVTNAFENAIVRGQVAKPAIDKDRRIVVRLQGIDAPELHYRPQAAKKKTVQTAEQRRLYLKWNEEYRQPFAETATMCLGDFLRRAGQDPLSCTVVSVVDEPGEVFDTYARFVGNILVQVAGQTVDINEWLVRQGLGFPAFYNSMGAAEIDALLQAGRAARTGHDGLWPFYAPEHGSLNWKLLYRRPPPNPPFDPLQDTGKVILPKLFRRLSTWAVNKRAKMVSGTFEKYLRDKKDALLLRDDFLEQGPAATVIRLDEIVSSGKLTVKPEDLVFTEKPSRITGPGGAPVNW